MLIGLRETAANNEILAWRTEERWMKEIGGKEKKGKDYKREITKECPPPFTISRKGVQDEAKKPPGTIPLIWRNNGFTA